MTFSVPYDFVQGHSPLLVSMPHSGLQLTPSVANTLIPEALALPDTDWHIPQLYDFLESMGVSVIKANYSRYVIDLNRPEDDKPLYAGKTTGLFPHILFNEKSMFKPAQWRIKPISRPVYNISGSHITSSWRLHWRVLNKSLVMPFYLMPILLKLRCLCFFKALCRISIWALMTVWRVLPCS